MQCRALTNERKRCAEQTPDASDYCAAHRSGDVMSPSPRPNRLGNFLSRVRGNGLIHDGGKYEVPNWLKDAPTLKVIEALTANPDSMVRWMAAYVLRKRRAVQAIEPLWSTLQNDSVRFVRQQAAVALGKIGTPVVFAPLVEGLNHDRDQGVRQACAIALGNLGLPNTVDEMVRVLEYESSIFVRWDCIVALGQLGDPRVEKLLVRLQAEEIALVIRDACGDALAEIRQRDKRLNPV